jgi:hypothetical protein
MSDKKHNLSIFNGDEQLGLFSDNKFDNVRITTHKGKVYFCIIDMIEILAESTSAKTYWGKMKAEPTENGGLLNVFRIWEQLKITGRDGKKYFMDCADMEGMLRIVQSIQSPKAEPFKQWMAKVAVERIEEERNPELTLNRSINKFKKMGLSNKEISNKLKYVDMRNQLTDSLKKCNVTDPIEYALLTNKTYIACEYPKASDHKELKGLKPSDNLRDHFTSWESTPIFIVEEGIIELNERSKASGYDEVEKNVEKAAIMALKVKHAIEEFLGHSIISAENNLTDKIKQKRLLDNKKTKLPKSDE